MNEVCILSKLLYHLLCCLKSVQWFSLQLHLDLIDNDEYHGNDAESDILQAKTSLLEDLPPIKSTKVMMETYDKPHEGNMTTLDIFDCNLLLQFVDKDVLE